MRKAKENAAADYMQMNKQSWTYCRLTEAEKKRWNDLFIQYTDSDSDGSIKGTYESRWKQYNALYSAFLAGAGYGGHTWREPNEESIPMF